MMLSDSRQNSGWALLESPFHPGERAIQDRFGIQDRMDSLGRRMIRDYLLDQHQQFFAQLSYVIAGTVDAENQLWASILVGDAGFLSAPNPHTLQIAAQPLWGDPLARTLGAGSDIGLLGIELHSRRRNRLNGMVNSVTAEGIEIQVRQSFGNCPQYIQARQFQYQAEDPTIPKPVYGITQLGAAEQSLITAADTFFIATAYQGDLAGVSGGVDVSHRGGKPGFVRMDNPVTLMIPDFSGNHHFNTFGNLELNPQAGLLFVDFTQGDLLYLTGTADVIWDGPEISAYPGAERLLRFRLHQGYRVEGSLPLHWSAPEFSPFLDATGTWDTLN